MSYLSSANGCSILVIDDDHFLNELFCQFLLTKGFQTESAHSVAEAIAQLNLHNNVDLILLDYQLGDGTGLELLAKIRDYLEQMQTPVIMVSGNEDPVFLENCFAAGVADYIIKPVNLSLLALKVSALIKSINLQRLISLQNIELERFKREAEREESVAKLTYEYLLHQNSQLIKGVSIWLRPSTSFSGDIALAKLSPSGDLYFLLADATGHGLSAAITVMPVVSIFNSMVAKGFHIQAIVAELNRKLVRDTPPDRFVAAVLIQIQQERKELDVWNGGMPAIYWADGGEIKREFKSQHMALGILDEEFFDATIETCEIEESGTILIYTDGLIEEVDENGVSFSSARVLDVIKAAPIDLQQTLINELAQYTGRDQYHDDVSICTLNPQVILKSCALQLHENLSHGYVQEDIGEFAWSVKITGKKIANCELPPLCNKFLRYIDLNQYFCQIVFLVVSEMVSNAIDHGILKLDSTLKDAPEGFTRYFAERERRLSQLTNSDSIELRLEWGGASQHQLLLSVKDSGAGYAHVDRNIKDNVGLSGRGLELIRSLAKSVEVIAPGNIIKAVISPS